MTDVEMRILQPSDKEAVAALGKRYLSATDPTERELQSWDARWRGESLDHYLGMGWSFGAFHGPELVGFVLGQPLLFFRGMTQTLWLEHVTAPDQTVAGQLLECAVRWARDKHFQCVCSESTELMQDIASVWKPSEALPVITIKTARY